MKALAVTTPRTLRGRPAGVWEVGLLVIGADDSHPGAMGAEKRLLPIKEAFRLAQQPHQNQAKLVVALSRTYGTVSCPPSGQRLGAAPLLPGPASPRASRGPSALAHPASRPVQRRLPAADSDPAACPRSPGRCPHGDPPLLFRTSPSLLPRGLQGGVDR